MDRRRKRSRGSGSGSVDVGRELSSSGETRDGEAPGLGVFQGVPGKWVKKQCHCPVTGRMGDFHGSLKFSEEKPIECLLSRGGLFPIGKNGTQSPSKRKTEYTVEALSLKTENDKTGRERWLGINQTAANRFVEEFLRGGYMPEIVAAADADKLKRESALSRSRIDFAVGQECFIEVKTMVMNMQCADHPNYEPLKKGWKLSADRIVKHLDAISGNLSGGSAVDQEAANELIGGEGGVLQQVMHGKRSIMILCHLWDAPPFAPERNPSYSVEQVVSAALRATEAGVENWQVNIGIDEKGIQLLRYFRLDMAGILKSMHQSKE
jgi:DNA-binding sugar fermentation-stimulating protein